MIFSEYVINISSLPYTCKLSKCACGKATCKGRVPDIIFSTVEPPPNAPITGIDN